MLLPVRDAAATVARALRSVLCQTCEDIEVVVVDDGSSDDTATVLGRIASTDARVRVITTPPRGIVPALEAARDAARAPLLARMDADDVSAPRRIECQRAAMEARPRWVVCGTHVRIASEGRLPGGLRRYQAWLNGLRSAADVERDLFVECPLAHPTWMLRADAVAGVGGYRDVPWAEDHDLLFRLRAAGGRLGVVPEVLLEWTDRPDRLSRTGARYSLDAFARGRAHHLVRLHPRALDGVVVCGAGPVGKRFRRALGEEGVPAVGFVDVDPRKVGQEIHGLPVVGPGGLDRWRQHFVVAAVSGLSGRASVRALLKSRGRVEGREFVTVA